MHKILKLDIKIAFAIFVILDILCAGMGMGVPIFCILLGFPVGWYISNRVIITQKYIKYILGKVLLYAIVTSVFTSLLMIVLWGRCVPMFFNPASDFKNFGIPLILYEPKVSFVGWLVLMIFISPFLQLLTTIFTSYIIIFHWSRSKDII